jgi:hypothetical protein
MPLSCVMNAAAFSTAMARLFAAGVNGHAFGLQHLDESVQVFHAIVQHEAGRAGIEIRAGSRKNGPYRFALLTRIFSIAPEKPGKSAFSPTHARDPQMLFIPSAELFHVLGFEKKRRPVR